MIKIQAEMNAWQDIRLIPDFACVTVPDEIEYPHANYSNFKAVFNENKVARSLKNKATRTILYDIFQITINGR